MPLEHTVLSHTFVGVWTTPLPGIPNMDAGLLQNLFGDPYTTNIGFGQDGSLVVKRMMKPPASMALFGPLRFQIICPTLGEMVQAFGKLRQEAYTRTNQQIPHLSSLGINTEHEWTRETFSPRFLAERYIRKGLFDAPIDAEVITQTINFGLKLTSPPRLYNIQLQPRAGRDDGIFAAVNDHRDWLTPVPTAPEIEALFNDSVRDIAERLTPLLVGGVAENA